MSDYDPFDHKGQREDTDRAKFIAQHQQRDDIAWLMSDPRGRRLMWSWLEFCGINRTSMTGNSQTFFLEGARNVGLMLQGNIVEHAPDAWLLMQNEARARRGAHTSGK